MQKIEVFQLIIKNNHSLNLRNSRDLTNALKLESTSGVTTNSDSLHRNFCRYKVIRKLLRQHVGCTSLTYQ